MSSSCGMQNVWSYDSDGTHWSRGKLKLPVQHGAHRPQKEREARRENRGNQNVHAIFEKMEFSVPEPSFTLLNTR